MDDFVVISLLRHGLTIENERSAYIGWKDSSLSQKGEEHAVRSRKNIEDAEIIFSSSLSRCIETANILFPDREVSQIENLREMSFGNWEGKTYEELKHLKEYQYWLDHIYLSSPLNGESFVEFSERVQIGWEKVRTQILKKRVKSVSIITHGGVIRYLLTSLSKDKKSFFDWKVPYVGGFKLTWTRDGLRRNEKCMSLQEVPITENPLG